MTAAPSFGTETIKAVVIDGHPARALWVTGFTDFFIPEVDKRLAETGNYGIEWQETHGGSVVKPKGVLEGIELGLGDIGIVTTIFHSCKLPSQAISAVTPFVAPDARAVAGAVDEIAIGANIAGTLVVLGVVAIVNYEIFARGVFNQPFRGTVEVSQFSMVLIVFLQLAGVVRVNRHTRFEGLMILRCGRFSGPGADAAQGGQCAVLRHHGAGRHGGRSS